MPASPKTCQLCWARRAWRLIASWNGRMAVLVVGVVLAAHRNRLGYTSAGGDHPVD